MYFVLGIKHLKVILIFFFFVFSIRSNPYLENLKPLEWDVSKEKQIEDYINVADYYYKRKIYDKSLFFYEYLYQNFFYQESLLQKNNPELEQLKAKLILNYVRIKENHIRKFHRKYLLSLLKDDGNNFSYNYISMYGSFRFGFFPYSFNKMYRIEKSSVSIEKKEYAKLLFGSIYFEENFHKAKNFYKKLSMIATNSEVKEISSRITMAIEQFEKSYTPKNPTIAAVLSSVLPGSGYFYTYHYMDGLFSMFWNFSFLGGGIYMYNLESANQKPHTVSYGFLFMGISFYIANIIGSYTSAIRYNNYQIRLLYQKIRKLYFNTDFIERTSGIAFSSRF